MVREGRWLARAWVARVEKSLKAFDGLGIRPIEHADLSFLQSLYALTREDEIAATGWSEAKRRDFLLRQFELQHAYYQAHHTDADFLLIERGGHPIGRLYWKARGKNASLIDVSLLPEARGHGIGTALLACITADADGAGLSIELHVEPDNPVIHLYQRFGFERESGNGVYLKMRRAARALVHTADHGATA
jgi:ribosomal protein S18 acetylase RimI-like enzyme